MNSGQKSGDGGKGSGKKGKNGGDKNGENDQSGRSQSLITCACGQKDCKGILHYTDKEIRTMTYDELIALTKLLDNPEWTVQPQVELWIIKEIVRRDSERKLGATGRFHQLSGADVTLIPKSKFYPSTHMPQKDPIHATPKKGGAQKDFSNRLARKQSKERLLDDKESQPVEKNPRQISPVNRPRLDPISTPSITVEDDYFSPLTPGTRAAETLSHFSIETPGKRVNDKNETTSPPAAAQSQSIAPPSTSSSLYFEPQTEARCGQHALNHIMQGPFFTAQNLTAAANTILQRLVGVEDAPSNEHIDDGGNYSLEVLETALGRHGINLAHLQNPEFVEFNTNPELATSYLVNPGGHWYALRRFGRTWVLLDSMRAGPQRIDDINLLFRRLNENFATIYAVQGDLHEVNISNNELLQLPAASLPFSHQPKLPPVENDIDRSQVGSDLKPYGRALWKVLHKYSPLTNFSNGAIVYGYTSLGPNDKIDDDSDIPDAAYIGSSINEEQRDNSHAELWAENNYMVDITGQMSVGAAIDYETMLIYFLLNIKKVHLENQPRYSYVTMPHIFQNVLLNENEPGHDDLVKGIAEIYEYGMARRNYITAVEYERMQQLSSQTSHSSQVLARPQNQQEANQSLSKLLRRVFATSPFIIGVKPCTVYGISPELDLDADLPIDYIGRTSNIYHRKRKWKSVLQNLNIQLIRMIDELSIGASMDLEALLIWFCKNILNVKLKNEKAGTFASKPSIFLNILNDENHEDYNDLIAGIQALFNIGISNRNIECDPLYYPKFCVWCKLLKQCHFSAHPHNKYQQICQPCAQHYRFSGELRPQVDMESERIRKLETACNHCKSELTSTSNWRVDPFNKLKKWCNACFAFYNRTGELRPSSYFGRSGDAPTTWNCTVPNCSNNNGKGYTVKSNYTRHMQAHSEETFNCHNQGCPNNKQKGYKTKEALVRHQKACKFPPPP